MFSVCWGWGVHSSKGSTMNEERSRGLLRYTARDKAQISKYRAMRLVRCIRSIFLDGVRAHEGTESSRTSTFNNASLLNLVWVKARKQSCLTRIRLFHATTCRTHHNGRSCTLAAIAEGGERPAPACLIHVSNSGCSCNNPRYVSLDDSTNHMQENESLRTEVEAMRKRLHTTEEKLEEAQQELVEVCAGSTGGSDATGFPSACSHARSSRPRFSAPRLHAYT